MSPTSKDLPAAAAKQRESNGRKDGPEQTAVRQKQADSEHKQLNRNTQPEFPCISLSTDHVKEITDTTL